MGSVRKIINKSSKVSWQIDYIDPFGNRVRQTFKKKKDADAELAKRESLIAEKRYLDVKKDYKTTLWQLAEKYEENFKHQSSYKTAKKFFIKGFKEYFGEDRLLATIRYLDLETYRNHLKNATTQHGTILKTATVNRTMSCLRQMFKKAIEWEMADENPFDKGQSLVMKESNQRLRYLTEDEIERLLDSCSTKVIEFPNSKNHIKRTSRKDEHYLCEIVECAINTGMRKGEILSLEWDQIRDGFIYLTKTKTLNPRQIPINDDLNELFRKIRQRQGLSSKFVFIFQGKHIEDIKTSFIAALKRANISNFRFHDLRHTFASHFVMRGGDLKALQEILGHTTLTMTMKYAHLAPEHKKKAVNLLNGLTSRYNGANSQKDRQTSMSENVRFSKNEKLSDL